MSWFYNGTFIHFGMQRTPVRTYMMSARSCNLPPALFFHGQMPLLLSENAVLHATPERLVLETAGRSGQNDNKKCNKNKK